MAARAIWKGVIELGEVRLPVKLYSAVEDRAIRFRLLHRKDGVPLRQQMINPVSQTVVDPAITRRGLEIERDLFVILDEEELEALEPEPSREIRIARFVDPSVLDPQWYDRPYYLGPDGNARQYLALARALERRGREGIAQWTMRKKRYRGALRSQGDHLLLITLRHSDEIIPASALEAPAGRALEARERDMAEKFVAALEEDFDPNRYHDEYRERVRDLIERKRKGETIEAPEPVEKRASEDLAELLEASLARIG